MHTVLRVNVKQRQVWSVNDVVERQHHLHKSTLFTQMFVKGDTLSQSQQLTLDNAIAEYCKHLHDISWFMGNLNEYIAR